MNEKSQDEGIITVLLQRFKTQNLPRLLMLKEKVDHGKPLDDLDMRFMKEVFANFGQIQPLLERHPEYEDLVIKAVQLYKDISDNALGNEQD
ncbi:MAG: hypothetical protein GQ547_01055 [Methylophaga sp.]|nr:hypothetical protein [Methylophaga sp.]